MTTDLRTRRRAYIAELAVAQATLDRVLAALAHNAGGTKRVNDRMTAEGIFGVPFSATMHPLCLYVGAKTDLQKIRIIPRRLIASVGDLRLPPVDLPDIVWNFVIHFDQGKFPGLELQTSQDGFSHGRCEYCHTSLVTDICHVVLP